MDILATTAIISTILATAVIIISKIPVFAKITHEKLAKFAKKSVKITIIANILIISAIFLINWFVQPLGIAIVELFAVLLWAAVIVLGMALLLVIFAWLDTAITQQDNRRKIFNLAILACCAVFILWGVAALWDVFMRVLVEVPLF
ncbi:MAG: hypothetical protein FWG68_01450 [Defluviitaleaceae bacterium]|nr:hypothetical protein [Defluviitaleaceae bacterium]